MITSLMMPPYVSKGTFKASSEVKLLSVVQMNVKLNTSILEKNTHASSESDLFETEDTVNLSVVVQPDYQKTRHCGGLEFCHEHLFDVII